MGYADDLKKSALDWQERKRKQAEDVADRLRSTARVNAPLIEGAAAGALGPTAEAALGAGTILKQGLTPTAPTAEDKPQVTPPAPTTAATKEAAPTDTFAMPAMSSAGGTGRASTSITEGVKLSPETRGLLDQSGQEQRSALEQSSAAQQGANDLDADQARRTAREQERLRLEAAMDPKTLHISHQVDEERQKLKDLQSEKIDERHFQKSQTLGQRLGWALAMGLGGFAAGLRGGTNTAAQLYSQAIQDDIDAQRANLSHKTELQKGLLGDLEKQFSDEQQQDAAAQITGLNIYKNKLAAEGAESKNAIVKANTAREIAAADNLLAQQHAKFDEATSARVTRNYETVSGGGAGGGMTAEKLAEARQHIIDQIVASGKTPTPQMVDGYLALRYGLNPGQVENISKPGKGGGNAASTAIADAGITKSTAWDPRRYAPMTSTGKQMLTNEARNAQVMAAVHAQNPAARGLEAIQTIAGPYLIKPGDTQDVVDAKNAAFARDYGGAQGAPIADDADPGDFEAR